MMCAFRLLPFHINVTHVFARDAGFIQNDISRVPNNSTQEEPEGKKKKIRI